MAIKREKKKLARAIAYRIKDEKVEYLLIKAKKGGGYWQNPQGNLNPGEKYHLAAIRETKEETGLETLAVIFSSKCEVEYDNEKEGKPVHTHLTAYATVIDGTQEVVLNPIDGHLDYKWASKQEALDSLTRYPEQRTVFEEVLKKVDKAMRTKEFN